MQMNRRRLLQMCSMGVAAGGLGLYQPSAFGQSLRKSKVLIIGLPGGMSPFLGNAGAFGGTGWGGRNVTVQGEVSWDTEVFANLMQFGARYFAVAGSLGSGSHDGAKNFWYNNGDVSRPFPAALAEAIGGTGTLKVAGVGPDRIPEQRYEQITNIDSFLKLIGNTVQTNTPGAPSAPAQGPNLKLQADLMKQISAMGQGLLARNPRSLQSAGLGISGLTDAAQKAAAMPPAPPANTGGGAVTVTVNPMAIMADYGVTSTMINSTMASKLAAAEILLRSGLNVVTVVDEGGTSKWDTHDDNSGARGRALYAAIVPALAVFCKRMLGSPDMNVTIALVSEHSRITDKSNHGPHTAVPIFSDNVNAGLSTGVCNAGGFLTNPQPEQAFRSLLADLAKVTTNPFGTHAHNRLIKTV